MPTYDINIETPGLDRAREQFARFGRATAGAAQATADLTRLTIALSGAYLTTRRRVVSLAASVAGLSPALKIAAAAIAASTIELTRFLSEMERVGEGVRDQDRLAGSLDITRGRLEQLQQAAIITGDSVEDLARHTTELTDAQRDAIEAVRNLTIVMSDDYAQAAQAYAASSQLLDRNLENFRSNFLGLPELVLETTTAVNTFFNQLLNNFDRNTTAIAQSIRDFGAWRAELLGLADAGDPVAEATARLAEFEAESRSSAEGVLDWSRSISAAQSALEDVLPVLESIQSQQADLFGGAVAGEPAAVRTTQQLVRDENRRLALATSIANAAEREANLRTDLAILINRQSTALASLQADASATAEEIEAAQVRLEGFQDALLSLDEVTIELTPYQELFSQFSDGADATVERLNFLNTAIAELNSELAGTAAGTDRYDALTLAIAQATAEAMRLGEAVRESQLTPNEVALQEQINEATSRRELIISRTLGSVQEVRAQLEVVGDLTQQWSAELAQIEAQAIVSPEDLQRAQDLRDALAGLEDLRLQLDPEEFDLIAEQFRSRVQRGLTDGVYLALGGDVRDGIETFALTLGDAARDALAQKLIEALANSAIGSAASGFFDSIFGGILGGIGGGAGGPTPRGGQAGFRDVGFRQFGGRVQPGGIYGVGEAGPELFVPDQSGTVVPNNRIGGGRSVTINQTIQGGGDSEAERAALAQGVALATRAQIQQQIRDGRL